MNKIQKEIKKLRTKAKDKIKEYLKEELEAVKVDTLMFFACKKFDYTFTEEGVLFQIYYDEVYDVEKIDIYQELKYFDLYDSFDVFKKTLDAEKEKRMLAQFRQMQDHLKGV